MRFWFMNASGWAKTPEHVEKLVQVPTLTHIVMGSFTVEPRAGNTGGTNFHVTSDGTAVNSLGLPNGGLPYLNKRGAEMVRAVRMSGRTPVISVAGFAPSEFGTLADAVNELGAVIELNVGCPNVHDGGKQKEIISYNWADLQRTLEIVLLERSHKMQVWLKLSPYSNPLDHERAVRLINRFAGKVAVVGCNTFPNVSIYHEDGRPYLNVAENYAGMSGTAIKWVNLSQCRRFVERVHESIPVIGVGGIGTAQDLLDYARVGCKGAQVGAAFFKGENFRVFEEVAEALVEA